MQFWVRLCVFLLIFYHLLLDFNFKIYMRLIFMNFIEFSFFAINFSTLISFLDFSMNTDRNRAIFDYVEFS